MTNLSVHLHTEFDEVKNFPLTAVTVNGKSQTKCWWRCLAHSHEWESTPWNRERGQGCPICSNKKVLVGFNDFPTTHPEIASEFHPTKNSFTANSVTGGTNKKAWWLCPQGHEWETVIANRTGSRNVNCSYCCGQRVLAGFNDFESHYPELATEWDYSKNGDLLPSQVTTTSGKKVWWIGKCGHSFACRVSHRTQRNHGCAVCAHAELGRLNRKPKPGESLADLYPALAKQWHQTKNLPLTPSHIKPGADVRVTWVCDSKGHEWETLVYQRTGWSKSSCPVCSAEKYSSVAENAIFTYLKGLGFDVEARNRKALAGKEIDIFIPGKQIGIEYNGIYWHTEGNGKNQNYHYDKWQSAQQAGIELIQIWEDQWNKDSQLVLRFIESKLGFATPNKTPLLAPKITYPSCEIGEAFFSLNHLEGPLSASDYLALEDEKKIHAMISFKEQRTGELELRYATDNLGDGQLVALISHLREQYPSHSFVTTVDNMLNDYEEYVSSGFHFHSQIEPSFTYLQGKERKPLVKSELTHLNKLSRIWDAGRTSYRLEA